MHVAPPKVGFEPEAGVSHRYGLLLRTDLESMAQNCRVVSALFDSFVIPENIARCAVIAVLRIYDLEALTSKGWHERCIHKAYSFPYLLTLNQPPVFLSVADLILGRLQS